MVNLGLQAVSQNENLTQGPHTPCLQGPHTTNGVQQKRKRISFKESRGYPGGAIYIPYSLFKGSLIGIHIDASKREKRNETHGEKYREKREKKLRTSFKGSTRAFF